METPTLRLTSHTWTARACRLALATALTIALLPSVAATPPSERCAGGHLPTHEVAHACVTGFGFGACGLDVEAPCAWAGVQGHVGTGRDAPMQECISINPVIVGDAPSKGLEKWLEQDNCKHHGRGK